MPHIEPFPFLGAPARRALAAAGYKTLAALTKVDQKSLAQLHGMGPKSLKRLQVEIKLSAKVSKRS